MKIELPSLPDLVRAHFAPKLVNSRTYDKMINMTKQSKNIHNKLKIVNRKAHSEVEANFANLMPFDNNY